MDDATMFADSVRHLKSLTSLNLANTNITLADLEEVVAVQSNLTKLRIHCCPRLASHAFYRGSIADILPVSLVSLSVDVR